MKVANCGIIILNGHLFSPISAWDCKKNKERSKTADAYQGERTMHNNTMMTPMILMAMALTFFLVQNTFGQDMGTGSHSDGYGSYEMMGQDPDAVLLYGRQMMRFEINQNKLADYGVASQFFNIS